MKEIMITAYKLTDGSIVYDKTEAQRLQMKLYMQPSIKAFVEKHFGYADAHEGTSKEEIENVLIDNSLELGILLTNKMNLVMGEKEFDEGEFLAEIFKGVFEK